MPQTDFSIGPSEVQIVHGAPHTAWFAYETFTNEDGVSTIGRVLVRPRVGVEDGTFLDLGLGIRELGHTATTTLFELRVDQKPGSSAESGANRILDGVCTLVEHFDGMSADDPAAYLTAGSGKAF